MAPATATAAPSIRDAMIIKTQSWSGQNRPCVVLGVNDENGFRARAREMNGAGFVEPPSLGNPTDFGALVLGKAIYLPRLGMVLYSDEPIPASSPENTTQRITRSFIQPGVAEPAASTRPKSPYPARVAGASAADTAEATWGVQVTKADQTKFTGKGIRVAVLDSGINLDHPAFAGVPVVLRSFVNGPADRDDGGHGTHCASTICGRPEATTGRKYSVAPGVELYVAKIFDARQTSPEEQTLMALSWALEKGCQIISLSVGGQVQRGSPYSKAFEEAARKALEHGALLIAGAGNNSSRAARKLMPVNGPANCPSVMAVGAIDESLQIANGSNPALNGEGGEVNLVAPGMAVLSAGLKQDMNRMDGTSAAVPFVAGIAALWAESDPLLRGKELWKKLEQTADPSVGSLADVGRGLVQAPIPAAKKS